MNATPKPFIQPKPEYRRVERLALETLEECCAQLGLQEIPLPIPVERWIEHPLGIGFGVQDLTHLGERTLGAAFIKEREILVSDRLDGNDGPFRFTCAHELGHIILHKKVAVAFRDDQVGQDAQADRYERQADRFAAAFLMPIDLLVRGLFAVARDQKLDEKRSLVELMLDTAESEWLWRYRFLPVLTKRFGVSLSAMLNRFSGLRLPDRENFLPYYHKPALLGVASSDCKAGAFKIVDGFPVRSDSPAVVGK